VGNFHGQEAQVPGHGNEEQRDGKYQAHDQLALLGVDLFLASCRLDIFVFSTRFQRLEARRSNRAAKVRLADQGGDVAHARLLCGEAHLRLQHALERGQRFLQPPRVVVIAHAADQQVGFPRGDPVPGAFYTPDQVLQPGNGRVELDHGPLRR